MGDRLDETEEPSVFIESVERARLENKTHQSGEVSDFADAAKLMNIIIIDLGAVRKSE